MSITVALQIITGLIEALIRDNVPNPDTELGQRALDQLMQPFRAATLQRAEKAYNEAFAANPNAPLPNFLNKDAVINWYLESPDYIDATERADIARIQQIVSELAALQQDRSRHVSKLGTLGTNPSPDRVTSINATIAGIDSQISALESEKVDLED